MTKTPSITIVTLPALPGARVVRVIGPVYGTAVRSRTAAGNWFGGLRAVFGGSQTGYRKLIAATRDEALADLAARAAAAGANAVLGMRFDSGEFDAGRRQAMNEVTAYGTAVVVEHELVS